MASQFVRLNTYGAATKTGALSRLHENAFDILDEAGRAAGATPHIRHASVPTLLFGRQPQDLKARIHDLAGIARNERGAPLRRDAPLLYAIVASYPVPWRALEGRQADLLLLDWYASVLGWLEAQFGTALQSAVIHSDEERPHIHAFVVPPLGPRDRVDHSLHPGRLARQEARRKGADRIAGERAYRAGMRAFQDGYFEAVSKRFGHERIGPRRRRFQRVFALQRQTAARFLENISVIIGGLMTRLDQAVGIPNHSTSDEMQALLAMISKARIEHDLGRTDVLATLANILKESESFVPGPLPIDTARHQHAIDLLADTANAFGAENEDPGAMFSSNQEDDWEDDPGPDGFDPDNVSAYLEDEDLDDQFADCARPDEIQVDEER